MNNLYETTAGKPRRIAADGTGIEEEFVMSVGRIGPGDGEEKGGGSIRGEGT